VKSLSVIGDYRLFYGYITNISFQSILVIKNRKEVIYQKI